MFLKLSRDGRLQLYCDSNRIWEVFGSRKNGKRVRFDREGRLQVLRGDNRVKWKTPDENQDDLVGLPIMRISNEGFIAIFDTNSRTPLWKSDSNCPGSVYCTICIRKMS